MHIAIIMAEVRLKQGTAVGSFDVAQRVIRIQDLIDAHGNDLMEAVFKLSWVHWNVPSNVIIRRRVALR